MLEDKILVWKLKRGRKDVLCDIYEKYKHELVTLSSALLTPIFAADIFINVDARASKPERRISRNFNMIRQLNFRSHP
jgi:hypothetical protein